MLYRSNKVVGDMIGVEIFKSMARRPEKITKYDSAVWVQTFLWGSSEELVL